MCEDGLVRQPGMRTQRLAEGELPHCAQHVPHRCRQAASNVRPQAGPSLTPNGVFPGAWQAPLAARHRRADVSTYSCTT